MYRHHPTRPPEDVRLLPWILVLAGLCAGAPVSAQDTPVATGVTPSTLTLPTTTPADLGSDVSQTGTATVTISDSKSPDAWRLNFTRAAVNLEGAVLQVFSEAGAWVTVGEFVLVGADHFTGSGSATPTADFRLSGIGSMPDGVYSIPVTAELVSVTTTSTAFTIEITVEGNTASAAFTYDAGTGSTVAVLTPSVPETKGGAAKPGYADWTLSCPPDVADGYCRQGAYAQTATFEYETSPGTWISGTKPASDMRISGTESEWIYLTTSPQSETTNRTGELSGLDTGVIVADGPDGPGNYRLAVTRELTDAGIAIASDWLYWQITIPDTLPEGSTIAYVAPTASELEMPTLNDMRTEAWVTATETSAWQMDCAAGTVTGECSTSVRATAETFEYYDNGTWGPSTKPASDLRLRILGTADAWTTLATTPEIATTTFVDATVHSESDEAQYRASAPDGPGAYRITIQRAVLNDGAQEDTDLIQWTLTFPDTMPVSDEVAITPAGASIEKGATIQLTATHTLSGAPQGGSTFTWTSLAPAYATVDATGLVTGQSFADTQDRYAQIVATENGSGAADTVTIQVTEPSSGEAVMSEVTPLAYTFRTPTATDWSNGYSEIAVFDITIDDTKSASPWEIHIFDAAPGTMPAPLHASNGTSYVPIGDSLSIASGSGAWTRRAYVRVPLTGVTTNGTYNGTVKLRMHDADAPWTFSSESTLALQITIAGLAETVTVAPSADTILIDGTTTFTASAYDENSTEIAGAAFAWSSMDEGVATVDASGMVTGVAAGTTSIVATEDDTGVTGSATIVVEEAPWSITYGDGEGSTLTATLPTVTELATEAWVTSAATSAVVLECGEGAATFGCSVTARVPDGVFEYEQSPGVWIPSTKPASDLRLTYDATVAMSSAFSAVSDNNMVAAGTEIAYTEAPEILASAPDGYGTYRALVEITATLDNTVHQDTTWHYIAFATEAPPTADSVHIDPFNDVEQGISGSQTYTAYAYADGMEVPVTFNWSVDDPTVLNIVTTTDFPAAGGSSEVEGVDLGTATLTATDPVSGLSAAAEIAITSDVLYNSISHPAPTLTFPEPTVAEMLAEAWILADYPLGALYSCAADPDPDRACVLRYASGNWEYEDGSTWVVSSKPNEDLETRRLGSGLPWKPIPSGISPQVDSFPQNTEGRVQTDLRVKASAPEGPGRYRIAVTQNYDPPSWGTGFTYLVITMPDVDNWLTAPDWSHTATANELETSAKVTFDPAGTATFTGSEYHVYGSAAADYFEWWDPDLGAWVTSTKPYSDIARVGASGTGWDAPRYPDFAWADGSAIDPSPAAWTATDWKIRFTMADAPGDYRLPYLWGLSDTEVPTGFADASTMLATEPAYVLLSVPSTLSISVDNGSGGTTVTFPVPAPPDMTNGFIAANETITVTLGGNGGLRLTIDPQSAFFLDAEASPTAKASSDLRVSDDAGAEWSAVDTFTQAYVYGSHVATHDYRILLNGTEIGDYLLTALYTLTSN